MNNFYLKVKKLNEGGRINPPAKVGDCGYDVYSPKRVIIHPWQKVKIPLGVAIEFPKGWMCHIENKSGLSSKTGLLNVGGIIDNGYRGEVCAIAYNLSDDIMIIEKDSKVCQFVFYRVPETIDMEYVDELSDTERGKSGFGSTGKF